MPAMHRHSCTENMRSPWLKNAHSVHALATGAEDARERHKGLQRECE
jgi:hypothetical protein